MASPVTELYRGVHSTTLYVSSIQTLDLLCLFICHKIVSVAFPDDNEFIRQILHQYPQSITYLLLSKLQQEKVVNTYPYLNFRAQCGWQKARMLFAKLIPHGNFFLR